MKKLILSLLLFLIAGVFFLAATVPDDNALKSNADDYVLNDIQKSKESPDSIESNLDIADYGLFKQVRFNIDGREKTIGYGYLRRFHAVAIK